MRTTEEAEPETCGTIKKEKKKKEKKGNQQQAPAVASVSTGAPLQAQLWFHNQWETAGLRMEPRMLFQLWGGETEVASQFRHIWTILNLKIDY